MKLIDEIIDLAFQEDIGPGDYSSISTIPENALGYAQLISKDKGIIAGTELAKRVLDYYDSDLKLTVHKKDGDVINYGDLILEIEGKTRAILATERVLLNFMQRMSGIATKTNQFVKIIEHTDTQLLDTRKTTPALRAIEKWAVRIGGGKNHRMGLYDMMMIKDNHIDYAGGIRPAIEWAKKYTLDNHLNIKIEIEVRNEKELDEVLAIGLVNRILLDNFTPENIKKVLSKIPKEIETEASGNITQETLLSFAETGVDFISSGALTHSYHSIDLSLKASPLKNN